MRKVQKMTIVSQKMIAKNVFELVLSGDLVECMLQAGQFVNIKINEVAYPLLRRPISICHIDYELNQFTVIYRAEGEGTKLLSLKTAGELVDILGPLGTGFEIDEVQTSETVVLVGGGIGVPPMHQVPMFFMKKNLRSLQKYISQQWTEAMDLKEMLWS